MRPPRLAPLVLLLLAAGLPFAAPLAVTLVSSLAPGWGGFTFAVDPLAPGRALWGVAAALLAAGVLAAGALPPAAGALLGVAALGVVRAPETIAPLAPWLAGVACYAAARGAAAPGTIRRFVVLSASVSVLVSLHGLGQAAWNRFASDVTLVNPFGDRVLSTLGNPTFLADYLAMHLPLLLVLAERARPPAAFLAWAAGTAAVGGALVASGSKGGQLAALAAIVAWAVTAWRRRVFTRTRAAVLTVAAIAALAALLVLTPSLTVSLSRWVGEGQRFSFTQRGGMAAGSIRLLATAPLAGRGTGALPVLFPAFQPRDLHHGLGATLSVNHAHDDYLEIACDLGLPALGLLIWLGIASAFRGGCPPYAAGLRLSVLAGACAMAVNFVLSVPTSAFPLWVHAGFLAGRRRIAPPPSRAAGAAAALLALCLGTAALRELAAYAWYNAVAAALANGNAAAAVAPLTHAVLLLPAERHAWQHLGRSYEVRDEMEVALGAYRAAERLGPVHPITGLNVARVEREMYRRGREPARLDACLAALRRVTAANPWLTEPREWGGELSLDAGRREDAARFLGAPPEGFAPTPRWAWLRARWLLREGDPEGAREAMALGDRLAARVEASEAARELRAGRLREAERRAREAVAKDPGLGAAWETLAYALSAQGRTREARTAFASQAARQPAAIAPRLNVALLSINLRDLDAAKRSLAEAERLAPEDPEVLLTRARWLAALGRTADAVRAYEAVLTRSPKHAEAAGELGRLRHP